MSESNEIILRSCLREPIPEITEAASYLNEAVTAHLDGCAARAAELILRSNMPAIRNWTESLWGSKSPFTNYRIVNGAPSRLANPDREKARMPTSSEKRLLFQRDGYHCRFCGIPVIRQEIRSRIRKSYPDALPWGLRNPEQHAAFQAMWAQYDHLRPHARGGDNRIENIVVTCAPCNFGRGQYTPEEVGLANPMLREPLKSSWDGLERFR